MAINVSHFLWWVKTMYFQLKKMRRFFDFLQINHSLLLWYVSTIYRLVSNSTWTTRRLEGRCGTRLVVGSFQWRQGHLGQEACPEWTSGREGCKGDLVGLSWLLSWVSRHTKKSQTDLCRETNGVGERDLRFQREGCKLWNFLYFFNGGVSQTFLVMFRQWPLPP